MAELVFKPNEIEGRVFVNTGYISQPALSDLRSKGAPIMGITWLEFDPNYHWTKEYNEETEEVTLTWREKIDEPDH